MADEPDVVFGQWLVSLKRAVENPVATLKRIGSLVTSRIQNRFTTQVDVDGKEFPERMVPNIPGILEDLERGSGIKDRRFQPRPVLLDTGNLRWSISWKLSGSDSVEIGTAVDHAKYHQFGLERIIKITDVMKEGIRGMLMKFRKREKRRASAIRNMTKVPKESFGGGDVDRLAFLLHRDVFAFTCMKRPFVGLDDQDEADIHELIRDNFLRDALGGMAGSP
jgi:phage gpG-like protein